jgi:hypothetical protein
LGAKQLPELLQGNEAAPKVGKLKGNLQHLAAWTKYMLWLAVDPEAM